MMANPNECGSCAHDLASEAKGKGHTEVEGILICRECGEVCRTPQKTAPAPGTTPVQQTPQDVEKLAQSLAQRMAQIRNEIVWHDLHSPGAIIQAVDGGYLLQNRFGQLAVRVTLEEALQRMREWLAPPS